jgi:hypothetical protein
MNPDDIELEQELRKLRPASPSRLLLDGIARELCRETARPGRAGNVVPFPAELSRWFGWASAACFVATFLLLASQPRNRVPDATAPAAAGELRPIKSETVVIAAKDEGVVTLPDGSPVRRYRIKAVDTFTWAKPDGNAVVQWSVPREDVRLVPVNYF